MTEIKSNITCTRCGKDILYCSCKNSPRARIAELERENAELREKYDKLCKDVAELRHEFLICSLDDKDELGKLINKLAYEV